MSDGKCPRCSMGQYSHDTGCLIVQIFDLYQWLTYVLNDPFDLTLRKKASETLARIRALHPPDPKSEPEKTWAVIKTGEVRRAIVEQNFSAVMRLIQLNVAAALKEAKHGRP